MSYEAGARLVHLYDHLYLRFYDLLTVLTNRPYPTWTIYVRPFPVPLMTMRTSPHSTLIFALFVDCWMMLMMQSLWHFFSLVAVLFRVLPILASAVLQSMLPMLEVPLHDCYSIHPEA